MEYLQPSVSTKEAFETLIFERGVHNRLGLKSSTVRGYRRSYKQGKVSMEKMHELLRLGGWEMTHEPAWNILDPSDWGIGVKAK